MPATFGGIQVQMSAISPLPYVPISAMKTSTCGDRPSFTARASPMRLLKEAGLHRPVSSRDEMGQVILRRSLPYDPVMAATVTSVDRIFAAARSPNDCQAEVPAD